MPLVSVAIPSYNHAAFVGEAVASVLDQSLKDLELIVVDDGSTDSSVEVLTGFDDPRLTVIPQSNQGAHAALNRAIARARGTYVAILNSDDVYAHRRLETLVDKMASEPGLSLVGSHIQVINAAGRRLGIKRGYKSLEPWLLEQPERSFRAGDDLRAALLTENYMATTSNLLFRRKHFEQLGGFRNLRYAHDWDFELRLARLGDLALVHEPLLKYRLHGHNTIRENQVAMVFEICWCLAVHLPVHLRELRGTEWPHSEDEIDALLHSLHTYGVDRVLNVMLLQDLARNPERALALLDSDNLERTAYLAYIADHLPGPPAPAGVGSRLRRYASALLRFIRRRT
ncbi:MAG: glycosyltransferase [Anaerolineae bacterium]